MDAITKRIFLAAAVLMLCLEPRCISVAAQDLHEQATSALLAQDFNDPDVSYLLLDENGQVVAKKWDHPEQSVPVGSLIKPFLAAAYGQTHTAFPRFRCVGRKTCWLPRGHGVLQIRDAIAYSCNSYFHQLLANAGPDFRHALHSYGLRGAEPAHGDPLQATANPLALARAYLELTRHSHDAAISPVLQGLALSAQKGTGKAAGDELPHISVLAKTGTAPCIHVQKSSGDGLALIMTPADHPREILLVRLHGRPGSVAADTAGRIIAAIEGIGARQ